jgi:hypothetical protein
MSTIERRLRASVGMDAINGDSFERSVCGKQMIEAATEIERLKAAIASREGELVSCACGDQFPVGSYGHGFMDAIGCCANCLVSDGCAEASPQAAVPGDMRSLLFNGWLGCSNHGCIVRGKQIGMGTNGQCKCLVDASRTQLQMLQGKLQSILTHKERTE